MQVKICVAAKYLVILLENIIWLLARNYLYSPAASHVSTARRGLPPGSQQLPAIDQHHHTQHGAQGVGGGHPEDRLRGH